MAPKTWTYIWPRSPLCHIRGRVYWENSIVCIIRDCGFSFLNTSHARLMLRRINCKFSTAPPTWRAVEKHQFVLTAPTKSLTFFLPQNQASLAATIQKNKSVKPWRDWLESGLKWFCSARVSGQKLYYSRILRSSVKKKSERKWWLFSLESIIIHVVKNLTWFEPKTLCVK